MRCKVLTHAKISTHTLTWSVTGSFFSYRNENGNFNSHAHVERDAGISCQRLKSLIFQLTRSRGA